MQIGHNTEASRDLKDRAAAIAGKMRLQAQAKRQAKALGDEIKELYKDAAGAGYDKEILKGRIAELMMDSDQLELHFEAEESAASLIESYRHALGLLDEGGKPAADADDFMTAIDNRLRDAGYVQDDAGAWHVPPRKGVSETVADINAARAAKSGRIRGQRVGLPAAEAAE